MIDTSFLLGPAPVALLTPNQKRLQQLGIQNALGVGQLQQQAIQGGALNLQQQQKAIADQQQNAAAIRAHLPQLAGQPAWQAPTGGQVNALALPQNGVPAPATRQPAANALAGPAGPPSVVADPATGVPLPAAAPYTPPVQPVPQAPTQQAAQPAPQQTPTRRVQTPTVSDVIGWGVTPEAAFSTVEAFQKADKGQADIAELNGKSAAALQEYGANMAAGILHSKMDPRVIQFSLEYASQMGPQYATGPTNRDADSAESGVCAIDLRNHGGLGQGPARSGGGGANGPSACAHLAIDDGQRRG